MFWCKINSPPCLRRRVNFKLRIKSLSWKWNFWSGCHKFQDSSLSFDPKATNLTFRTCFFKSLGIFFLRYIFPIKRQNMAMGISFWNKWGNLFFFWKKAKEQIMTMQVSNPDVATIVYSDLERYVQRLTESATDRYVGTPTATIWRGVRSYAQCGCNVLAKFWRLVGCSKRLDW